MSKYEKFKLIILSILSVILIVLVSNYTNNGRYSIHCESTVILDTKTGNIYLPQRREYILLEDYKNIKKSKKEK